MFCRLLIGEGGGRCQRRGSCHQLSMPVRSDDVAQPEQADRHADYQRAGIGLTYTALFCRRHLRNHLLAHRRKYYRFQSQLQRLISGRDAATPVAESE